MRVMIPLFIINHSLAFRALCHLISSTFHSLPYNFVLLFVHWLVVIVCGIQLSFTKCRQSFGSHANVVLILLAVWLFISKTLSSRTKDDAMVETPKRNMPGRYLRITANHVDILYVPYA